MHTPSCFAGLSRAELAHVARCQRVAIDRRLSVVSSGVFAAEAGELAGSHFWLVAPVSSPLSVQVVWLSGRRLLCRCKRRTSDHALSCCHAQAVRLWLLAAAGAPVPPVPPVPPSGGGLPPASGGEVAADVADATQGIPVAPCPGCSELAPVDTVSRFGVCVECLDLEATAARAERPHRCLDCREPAIGETANGMFCGRCLAARQREYGPISQRDADLLGVSLP